VCGDRSYRHRRYDHFTLSLRQGCAPDDIPLRYRCDGTRVGVQRTAHGKAASPCEFSSAFDVARHYFPDADWGTAGHPMHVETRLPIWLYLTQHDRGN
ncbi:unnamed protein product, partial [Pylaiella littoralis]